MSVGANITLHGDQARYVGRVLRLRADDEVTLFDGKGGEYRALIKDTGKNSISAAIAEMIPRSAESPLDITVLQGISRGDRMDYVIQKTTELGVNRLTPIHTEFSMVKLDEERAAKRSLHWRKVATSACEQCGRNELPLIDTPRTLPNALAAYHQSESPKIIMKPGASATLSSIEIGDRGPVVLIGPEGGFSDQEYENAEAAGFQAVGFGPRVLRTETAAISIVTVLQFLYGDLG